MVKKLKDIVKRNPEAGKPSFGTNPMDPWSAKAGLAEGALEQYLLSRGINPKFISRETKISHSKSSSFLKWQQDHKFTEETVSEEVDKEDVLSFDIPLFIRILELAREDVKEDMELHRITERLLSIRSKGTLTMADYEFIAGLKKVKEECEIEESFSILGNKQNKFKHGDLANHEMLGKVKIAYMTKHGLRVHSQKDKQTYHVSPASLKPVMEEKKTALDKFRKLSAERKKKHDEIEKNQSKDGSGMSAAIDRLQKHLNKEEVEQIIPTILEGDDCSSEKKRQRSKSARMIKSLYKKNGMKESADGQSGGGFSFDKEKTDKPPQGYGKKPALATTDKKDHYGDDKPKARAIMTGGKTLTGEKRDNVEIDPALASRPDKPDEIIKDINTKKQNN